MPTATIPVSPKVVKWAREQMNLSVQEAAGKLGITPAALSELEATEEATAEAPSAVIRRMQSVYKRKRSVLLLPAPPPTRGRVALRTAGDAARPSETTLLAIRDVRRVQRFITEVVELDRELFPLQAIGAYARADDPESAATSERVRLGPSIEEQLEWTKQAQAVDRWRDALVQHGVAVTKKSMPWNECRGVSIAGDGVTPFIVINTQDTLTAMCFTMWHEYAHIVLGEGSACGLSGDSDDGIESWCNDFASAYLMPREAVVDALKRPEYRNLGPDDWTIELIRRFARLFKASPVAAARRLRMVAGVSFYTKRYAELWSGERIKVSEGDSGGGERAEVRAVREYGVEVTEAVVEAVNRGIVDAFEATQAVGVMASRLRDLDAEMQRRA